jgi:pimeloyl-ACP methyl ester carboxylesterase
MSSEKVIIDYRDHSREGEQNIQSEVVDAEGLRVHIADARPSDNKGDTIVVPRAFIGYSDDPFEQQRDIAIANALEARVIGIDTPGAGLDKRTVGKTNLRQKWDALQGRLEGHGDLQVRALLDVLKGDTDQLNFIGYSLGAFAVTAMLRSQKFTESGLQVGGIGFVEAVNDQDWPLLGSHGLQQTIAREDAANERYLRETQALGYEATAYDRDSNDLSLKHPEGRKLPIRLDSLLLGAGMRKGFADDFAAHLRETAAGTPIALYRANASGVARPEANEATATALRARLVEILPPNEDEPHRHPMWHSMGAAAMLAREIGKNIKKG